MPRKARLTEIDHMLAAFNLLDKRNAFSCSLSGGMKRRLSMIIALIGGSKVKKKKKKKQEGALKMDPPEAGLKKSANKNLRADKDLTL